MNDYPKELLTAELRIALRRLAQRATRIAELDASVLDAAAVELVADGMVAVARAAALAGLRPPAD